MAIKQKINIDNIIDNSQVIAVNETGIYNSYNITGYGGQNGTPASLIEKFIFVLHNHNTGNTYRQVQSDDITNPNEYYNPSIMKIVNKEGVYLDANNQGIIVFPDGVYDLTMNTQIKNKYETSGFQNSDVLINTQSAETLYNNYDGIITEDNSIYYFKDIANTTLILDRPLVNNTVLVQPILKVTNKFILYSKQVHLFNKIVSNYLDSCNDCGLEADDNLNKLSKLQLLDWAVQRCIINNDYMQAKEYLDMIYKLSLNFKCGC